VFDQLVLELLLEVNALVTGLRQAIDDIHHQVKAVQIIQHRHVERRGDGAFFLLTAYVNVAVVDAATGQPVYQPRVAVVVEDNGFVVGEQFVEIGVA
jgi:hypothetical protein